MEQVRHILHQRPVLRRGYHKAVQQTADGKPGLQGRGGLLIPDIEDRDHSAHRGGHVGIQIVGKEPAVPVIDVQSLVQPDKGGGRAHLSPRDGQGGAVCPPGYGSRHGPGGIRLIDRRIGIGELRDRFGFRCAAKGADMLPFPLLGLRGLPQDRPFAPDVRIGVRGEHLVPHMGGIGTADHVLRAFAEAGGLDHFPAAPIPVMHCRDLQQDSDGGAVPPDHPAFRFLPGVRILSVHPGVFVKGIARQGGEGHQGQVCPVSHQRLLQGEPGVRVILVPGGDPGRGLGKIDAFIPGFAPPVVGITFGRAFHRIVSAIRLEQGKTEPGDQGIGLLRRKDRSGETEDQQQSQKTGADSLCHVYFPFLSAESGRSAQPGPHIIPILLYHSGSGKTRKGDPCAACHRSRKGI